MLMLNLLSGFCYAQDLIEHVVQRGETLEFLARKYGVSIEDIKDQNEDYDLDELYVGLLLQIPRPELDDSSESIDQLIASTSSINSLLEEANNLYTNGSYRKAAKLYSSVIKDNPNSDLYFLRGRCFLRQGRYKSAVRDLEKAYYGNDLSLSLRSSCEDLLDDAHDKREAQLEARSEAWGKVFAAAALTTVAVVGAAAAANSQSNYASSSTYSSTYPSTYPSSSGTITSDAEFNARVQADLNQIAQYSVAQTQMQFEAEKNNFLAQYRSNYKAVYGSEPTEKEEMDAYYNYMQGLYGNSNDSNTTSSSSSSADSSTSTASTDTSSASRSGKKCLKWYATDHAHCNGSGICSRCNGKKAYWDYSLGLETYVNPCGTCHGTGKCPGCNGLGERY